MKCFYCGENIDTENRQRARIIALDRPYVNLFFHYDKGCYQTVQSYGEKTYLIENIDRIYEYIESEKNKGKIKKQKGKEDNQ